MTLSVGASEQTSDSWIVARTGPRFVTEGDVLRVTGGGGWLRNRVAFAEFVLRLEYRVAERGSEAAVLVRAWPDRPNQWPSTGYRISIGESGGGSNGLGVVRGYSGRVRTVTTGRNADPSPALSEWQELEIRAEADRLTVTMNGAVINVVEGTEPLAGYIGLEGSRGTVEFRNVRTVRLLDPGCRIAPSDERQSNSPEISVDKPGVYRPGTGVINPRVRREVKPRYTIEAQSKRVEGVVLLEAVVLPDGSVGRVCVVRALDEDLDAEAVAAARRWFFEPGTRLGEPVAVLVTIELSFRLRR